MKTKILIFFLSLGLLQVSAQISSIHNFTDTPDGSTPVGDLYFDGTFLYGTTMFGGTNDSGVVFKIKPDGTAHSVILNFTGSNGREPHGSLISDGTYLYGMTRIGGANHKGVIFKILPDGSGYSKLLDFSGSADGSSPQGTLLYDGNFLYGTAPVGGLYNLGTLFKLMPEGSSFTKIIDFSGPNGSNPIDSPIMEGGYIFGSTGGGPQGRGTIFKIMPDGTNYTMLAEEYSSTTLLSDGTYLYGVHTMDANYGSIFRIGLDGTGFFQLHAFADAPDGSTPYGSLILNGNFLYGTTREGGAARSSSSTFKGTIFKIKPDGGGYTKFNFSNNSITDEPIFPMSALTFANGSFYGTTWHGGPIAYAGTVYKFTDTTTGIEERNLESRITIFPNPSKGMFTFEMGTAFYGTTKLEVYNLLGKVIFSMEINKSSSEIDLSERPDGIYFIKYSNAEETFNKKIIISR